MEKESGRIAQAVYSILRMIDFIKGKEPYNFGFFSKNWISPASTYAVFYNSPYHKLSHKFNDGYYGYSFMFNFSRILDVSTSNIVNNLGTFSKVIDLYIKTCFLDMRMYDLMQLKEINKWNNAISMFNTSYEFASTEKYDACILILVALLESLFLKNEGRNKQERLIAEVTNFLKDIYNDEEIEKTVFSLISVYQFRNKIMHEGNGYEARFMFPRCINDYQGIYSGMRPFSYSGAINKNEEIMKIEWILKTVAKILICDKTLETIENIISKI